MGLHISKIRLSTVKKGDSTKVLWQLSNIDSPLAKKTCRVDNIHAKEGTPAPFGAGDRLGSPYDEAQHHEPEAKKAQEEKCTVVPSLLLYLDGAILKLAAAIVLALPSSYGDGSTGTAHQHHAEKEQDHPSRKGKQVVLHFSVTADHAFNTIKRQKSQCSVQWK